MIFHKALQENTNMSENKTNNQDEFFENNPLNREVEELTEVFENISVHEQLDDETVG